jgi:hypothetical protein
VSASTLPPLSRVQRAAVGLALLVVGLLVGGARVSYVQASDPFGTLLVSEALLQHGTVRLDSLGLPDLETRLGYRGFGRNGHTYYVYPLGTSLAATPFVAVARALGTDLRRHEVEVRLQHHLATLGAVVTLWLLVRLARRLLPFWPALTCAIAFWSGTSLASTGGTALWSHVLLVISALAAIDLIVDAESSGRRIAWVRLGVLLFLAYLTRPTAALLAVLLLLWAGARDRRGSLQAAGVAAGLFGAFVLASHREFGEWLPPYYRMGLDGGAFSGEALAGLLVSPSRGLLTFSPFLLALPAAAWLRRPDWPLSRGWWAVGIAWPVLLVLAFSRWTMWWGGGCYGARLLTDALPGLFLLVLRVWPTRLPRGRASVGVAVLALTVLAAGAIHVGQGLYNPWTFRWNGEPSVDTEPWARWTWRFPQFLHSAAAHRARLVAYYERQQPAADLTPLPSGTALPADAPYVEALGFDRIRPTGRWTLLPVAELLFVPDAGQKRRLTLTYGTNGRQAVRLELNTTVLLDTTLEADDAALQVDVPAMALQPGVNRLRFVLPDTRRIRRGDSREYGIVVKTLRLD